MEHAAIARAIRIPQATLPTAAKSSPDRLLFMNHFEELTERQAHGTDHI
jgi:hypothetical protein